MMGMDARVDFVRKNGIGNGILTAATVCFGSVWLARDYSAALKDIRIYGSYLTLKTREFLKIGITPVKEVAPCGRKEIRLLQKPIVEAGRLKKVIR